MKCHLLAAALCLSLSAFLGVAVDAAGTWTEKAYPTNVQKSVWVTEIASTVDAQLTCTVTWIGDNVQTGKKTNGVFTLIVPAYKGVTASIARHQTGYFYNFQQQVLCK